MARQASSVAFWDPHGDRHGGTPTWPWGEAPAHLATLRQLKKDGLRPGGQDVAGQILWRTCGGTIRVAYLYDRELAKPRRACSPAQREACAKALAARRICPRCHQDVGYIPKRRLGVCNQCADPWELEHAG